VSTGKAQEQLLGPGAMIERLIFKKKIRGSLVQLALPQLFTCAEFLRALGNSSGARSVVYFERIGEV